MESGGNHSLCSHYGIISSLEIPRPFPPKENEMPRIGLVEIVSHSLTSSYAPQDWIWNIRKLKPEMNVLTASRTILGLQMPRCELGSSGRVWAVRNKPCNLIAWPWTTLHSRPSWARCHQFSSNDVQKIPSQCFMMFHVSDWPDGCYTATPCFV